MATTRKLTVTGDFAVTVDESKFTQAFLEEFSSFMFPVDSVDDCIDHLGLMFARGVIDGSTKFIEGYGDVAEMGIKFEVGNGGSAWIDADVQIVDYSLEPI
jgi:hypothetical protein